MIAIVEYLCRHVIYSQQDQFPLVVRVEVVMVSIPVIENGLVNFVWSKSRNYWIVIALRNHDWVWKFIVSREAIAGLLPQGITPRRTSSIMPKATLVLLGIYRCMYATTYVISRKSTLSQFAPGERHCIQALSRSRELFQSDRHGTRCHLSCFIGRDVFMNTVGIIDLFQCFQHLMDISVLGSSLVLAWMFRFVQHNALMLSEGLVPVLL